MILWLSDYPWRVETFDPIRHPSLLPTPYSLLPNTPQLFKARNDAIAEVRLGRACRIDERGGEAHGARGDDVALVAVADAEDLIGRWVAEVGMRLTQQDR